MSATLIDGKAISAAVRQEWKERAAILKSKGVLPGLAVIIVGDNPASKLYVNNKIKAIINKWLIFLQNRVVCSNFKCQYFKC